MNNLNQNHEDNCHIDLCDMNDVIDELSEHFDSVNALVYIGKAANFYELDDGIYTDFLNGIKIINHSAIQLVKKIKEPLNNEV